MIALAKEGWQFFRENSFTDTLKAVRSRDAHPLVQFAKYGLCGGLSVIVLNVIVISLSMTVFPAALDPNAFQELAAAHLTYANIIAFFFANAVAYLTNRVLVFTPGRHSIFVEFMLFSLVAAAATAVGMAAGPLLVKEIGLDPRIAQASLVVTSAMVNFVARKFLVFSK